MSFSNWKEVELSSLVQDGRSIAYGVVQPRENVLDGVPIIKVNDVINGLNNIKRLNKTTYEIEEKYKRTRLRGGELIVSLVGTVGKCAIVPISFAGCNLVRAVASVPIENTLYSKWVYYYIQSARGKEYIDARLNTTVQPTFNLKDLASMPIPMPENKIIDFSVKLLSCLDDKIELNNQINRTLEEMAQAIFKSWFVDFEPFKDDEFEESELGSIPNGWRVGNLEEVCNIRYGKNLPTSKLINEGYYVFGGNGVIGYHDDYLYEEPQVLVSCRGAASGRVLTSYPYSFITNNSLVLEVNENINFEFLKYYCLNNTFEKYATGSAQPQITIENIKFVKVLIPKKETIEDFKDVVSIIEKKFYDNFVENKKLRDIRDTLLPKLMSGEIGVPVEEVQ